MMKIYRIGRVRTIPATAENLSAWLDPNSPDYKFLHLFYKSFIITNAL